MRLDYIIRMPASEEVHLASTTVSKSHWTDNEKRWLAVVASDAREAKQRTCQLDQLVYDLGAEPGAADLDHQFHRRLSIDTAVIDEMILPGLRVVRSR